jgi:hypothetical protein
MAVAAYAAAQGGAGAAAQARMRARMEGVNMMCHPVKECGGPPIAARAAAHAAAGAGAEAQAPPEDVGAGAGAHADASAHAGWRSFIVIGGCAPPPCPPPTHGPPPGPHGPAPNGTDGGPHDGDGQAPQGPDRPQHPQPHCGPCDGPSRGHQAGVHEEAQVYVRLGNETMGADERAGAHAGIGARLMHPCHPPCPPRDGPGAGAGVHEGVRVKARAGNETVDGGERFDARLRLGEGCRDRAGEPDSAGRRLGRHIRSVEAALDALAGQLDRMNATLARLSDELSTEGVSDERADQITVLMDRLVTRMDETAQKITELQVKLGNALQHAEELDEDDMGEPTDVDDDGDQAASEPGETDEE